MDDDLLNIPTSERSINPARNGEINDVNDIPQSNNSEILLSAIEEHMQNNAQYFNSPLLSDCLLKIGTKKYYAHKFILAKSSDVFQTMFYTKHWSTATPTPIAKNTTESQIVNSEISNDTMGCNIDQYELVETEECAEVFEKFLKFFYVAEILISNEEVIGLLYLSDKYNVTSLRNVASQYMIIQAKSPHIKNAIDWYRIAKDFKQNDLKEVCLKTIAWNTEFLINSDDWLNVDIDFLKDLLQLQTTEIVIKSEFLLYNAISKWLLYENDTSNGMSVGVHRRNTDYFKQNCLELLPLIRFSQMMDTDLYEIEKSELAENFISADLIKQQLYKAYRFRVLEELLLKTLNSNRNDGSPSRSGGGGGGGISGIVNGVNMLNRSESDSTIATATTSTTVTVANTNLTEFDKSNDIEFYDTWYLPRDYTDLNLVDIVEIKNTLRVGIQVDVKTYKGVAPKKDKTVEWKVLYRVSSANINRWSLRITCSPTLTSDQVSAMCKAKISLIVYNNEHLVLQVERGRTFTFNGTNYCDIELNLTHPNETKELYLLIKPVLF